VAPGQFTIHARCGVGLFALNAITLEPVEAALIGERLPGLG
jgi:hypothetical protein